MTREHWQRIEALFDAALQLTVEQRGAFLDAECANDDGLRRQIEEILRSASNAETVEQIVARAASSATGGSSQTASESSFAEGRRIGPYRITGVIGSGGMGTVFRAVRDDRQYSKEVAIKALTYATDASLISRFKYERHALAAMDHPNIAKVLDAGASDSGELYLVMELVDGEPLTTYAEARRLSIPDRLRLLIQVCKAVQHAHQKGIIHRDLKPSNVLVTMVDGAPTPKVIDFGIAKAVQGLAIADPTMQTKAGAVIGTLEYMSPEQSGLTDDRVDTRSDVYSLGVIFYELLAGSRPLSPNPGDSIVDFVRRITEEEPPPPSVRVRSLGSDAAKIASQRSTDVGRLIRELSGEIDWIAARALEKDPERRYESATALVLDIERYLNGDPVQASPATAAYRIEKFVRKHSLAIGVAVAFVVTLTAAAAVSTWQAIKARRAGEITEAVSTFLQQDVLAQANPEEQSSNKPNPQLTVRDALDRAALTIGSRFSDKPMVEAAIRRTIGQSYIGLGQFDPAGQQFQRAADLLSKARGPMDRETLATRGSLGEVLWLQGRMQDGISMLSEVISELKSVEGAEGDDTLTYTTRLGGAYLSQGEARKAVDLLEPATRIMERKYGPESRQYLQAVNYLADAYTRNGEWTRAIETDEKVLAIHRRLRGPDHPATLAATHSLADAYFQSGQYARSESLYKDTIERQSRALGARHVNTLTAKNDLANVHTLQGDLVRATPLLTEVYQAHRESLGADHMKTLVAGHNVAGNLTNQGRYSEAEQMYLEAIAGMKRSLPAEHPQRLLSESMLARLYRAEGRYAQAEEITARVLATERKTLGPESPQTLTSMGRLAGVYAAMGRDADAEKLDLETVAAMRRVLGPTHLTTLTVSNHLAVVYWKQRKFNPAIALLREIQPFFEKELPGHWQRFHSRSLLGMNLVGAGQTAEGEPLVKAGYAGMMQRKAMIPATDRDFLDRVAKAAAVRSEK